MGWFHRSTQCSHSVNYGVVTAADQAIARHIATQLVSALPEPTELAEPFEPDARAKVVRVAKVALEHLQNDLQEVVDELVQTPRRRICS